ncbi:MAG: glycosyltransferase family protein [Porticoccaceae bacterium]|nr:glycosyltransferase family protein [Porticoccaceae bacterium]
MMIEPAIAIIQARMSSTRFPKKVLKPLAGKPMIWHIVERARSCRWVNQVIVATSTEASDDPLSEFCANNGIACHRGSLNNVLRRYLEALDRYPHSYVVRITGDCPLIDPDFIDRQIQALTVHDGDQIWLSVPAPILDGQGVHSSRSLRYISERSDRLEDLEHVGSRYMADNPEQFRIIGLHPPKALTEGRWRVTVDETPDYEMMQHLYDALWQGSPIPLHEALEWMALHPELAGCNQAVSYSAINQDLAVKRQAWVQYVDLFCSWDDPFHVISSPLDSTPKAENP